MASELEQEMMGADEQVNDDEFYAYVVITANGMGSDHYGADECNVCGEKIEWNDGWHHEGDEPSNEPATCDGAEVEPSRYKNHNKVWNTLPESVQKVLETTDDTNFGEDVEETYEVETKWVGWLNQTEWEDLKSGWGLDPERSDRTMGILAWPEGHMWALSETHDGMDWNMGGLTPLDYMNIYYCSQDPDVMKVAKEYGYFGEDENV